MPWLRLGVLLAIPVALACIPTSVVESGPTLCLYKAVLGHDCWGCGMTRAMSCAAHGQFVRAWRHNRCVVLVGPLLAGAWWMCVLRQWRRARQRGPVRRRAGRRSAGDRAAPDPLLGPGPHRSGE